MKKLLFILILFCSLQGFGQIKGYWRLNGNSNDASGNGNNGTDTNITYSQANGRLNQGGGFNGTSSSIYIGNGPYLTIFTLSALVYIKSFANYNFIISRGVINYRNYELDIRITTGKVNVGSTRAGGIGLWEELTSNTAIQLNTWVYIVGIYTGSKWQIYINGILDAESSKTFTPYNSGDLYIGQIKDPNKTNYYFLNGNIDEVIIDNTAWSPARVKNEYIRMLGAFSN